MTREDRLILALGDEFSVVDQALDEAQGDVVRQVQYSRWLDIIEAVSALTGRTAASRRTKAAMIVAVVRVTDPVGPVRSLSLSLAGDVLLGTGGRRS